MIEFDQYGLTCPACQVRLIRESYDNSACHRCLAELNKHQWRYAKDNPSIYLSEIVLANGKIATVLEMADKYVHGKIVAVFGVFAVTEMGVESLDRQFMIKKSAFHERNWEAYMSVKKMGF